MLFHEHSSSVRSLGLATHDTVLWNTLDIQKALRHINVDNPPTEINGEDISILSPLMHGHINMFVITHSPYLKM